jgi:hypothetical protein
MAKSFQDLSWSINEYAVRHIEETDDWLRVETLVISNIPRLCRGRTQDANHLLLVFRLLTLNHLAKFKEYRVLRTAMKWLLHILGIVSTYAHIYIFHICTPHTHTLVEPHLAIFPATWHNGSLMPWATKCPQCVMVLMDRHGTLLRQHPW